jgi:hypothetical protein
VPPLHFCSEGKTAAVLLGTFGSMHYENEIHQILAIESLDIRTNLKFGEVKSLAFSTSRVLMGEIEVLCSSWMDNRDLDCPNSTTEFEQTT